MENTLFIRLRLLGDIIFTIPSIQLYRQRYPQHRLYYVVEEDFKEIACLIPGIHEVILIPRQMGTRDIMGFRKKVRQIGFSQVIDFHSGPKSAFLTYFTGIKKRFGYRTPNRKYAYTGLTHRKILGFPTHSTFNQAMLLEHMDISIKRDPETIPPYPPIDIQDESVSQRLSGNLSGDKRTVIHVGAGNRFRDWGIDHFSRLIEKLVDDRHSVFLIGKTEQEKMRGEVLANRFGITDLTGQLSVRETLYVIDRSEVYVGFDSGPLHLASLTQTPIVAMYGPNIPEISGPWRKKDVTIIQLDMNCRPCSQRKCIYDTIACINGIEVDHVYKAVKKYTG